MTGKVDVNSDLAFEIAAVVGTSIAAVAKKVGLTISKIEDLNLGNRGESDSPLPNEKIQLGKWHVLYCKHDGCKKMFSMTQCRWIDGNPVCPHCRKINE